MHMEFTKNNQKFKKQDVNHWFIIRIYQEIVFGDVFYILGINKIPARERVLLNPRNSQTKIQRAEGVCSFKLLIKFSGKNPPSFRDVFPVSCQRSAGTACLHADAPARFQSSRFSVKQFDWNKKVKRRFVDFLFLLCWLRFVKHWSRNGREHRSV